MPPPRAPEPPKRTKRKTTTKKQQREQLESLNIGGIWQLLGAVAARTWEVSPLLPEEVTTLEQATIGLIEYYGADALDDPRYIFLGAVLIVSAPRAFEYYVKKKEKKQRKNPNFHVKKEGE